MGGDGIGGMYVDWRLPNVRELHSRVDYGRHAPSLDPIFDTTAGPFCWTSTSRHNFEFKASYVGLHIFSQFEGGIGDTEYTDGFNIINGSPRELLHLRAVRDAP